AQATSSAFAELTALRRSVHTALTTSRKGAAWAGVSDRLEITLQTRPWAENIVATRTGATALMRRKRGSCGSASQAEVQRRADGLSAQQKSGAPSQVLTR